MSKKNPFEHFLEAFVPQVESKSRQLNLATWILETTGSSDASALQAALNSELRLLYSDPHTLKQLVKWDRDPAIKDPLLKRQLNVLLRAFKKNAIPPHLLVEISNQEAALQLAYANFRAEIDGTPVSDNDIRQILSKEDGPSKRKKAWEASKQIGVVLAPQILSLVALRNEAAQSAGYADYFQMELELYEVDEKWLFRTFDDLAERSDAAYRHALKYIEKQQSARFGMPTSALGPWAWSEPFCQEDPLDICELDTLVAGADLCDIGIQFYKKMGIDIVPTLKRSDMFERPGKNQHAFCMSIDRAADVRTLNNVKPTMKWMETVLHEFGHAIYDLGFDPALPWLLREPPHMIPTEAMALVAGRKAYLPEVLRDLLGHTVKQNGLIMKAEEGLKRRQLIFSRWVLVMTYFERELYRNPSQDLNKLWWELIEKFQKIRTPKGRKGKEDWAAKYHLGLAPVYYYSYLLGEMFASAIEETLVKVTKDKALATAKAGRFLQDKLFFPGNSLCWSDLVKHVTGKPLSADPWLHHFS